MAKLLTTAQVAEQYDCPIRTVNRWAREGRLLCVQKLPGLTGAFLFDPDDVERFFTEKTRLVRRAI